MKYLLAIAAVLASLDASAATADELPSGRNSLIQVAPFARYDRFDADTQGGRAGLSSRIVLGSRLGYAIGLDLDAGATGSGAVFNAELYPIGVGLRFGRSGALTLSAGVGAGGAGGDVRPTALQIPVELRGRVQLGPVRAMAWTVARETPLTDERDLELEASIALGWGSQRTYWGGTSSGSGPFVAVTGHRVDDETALSIAIGIEIVGAN
jgi:hypothetical protein